MIRPQREAYARGVMQCGTLELVAGLEYRAGAGESFTVLRDELRTLLGFIALGLVATDGRLDEDALAMAAELAIRGRWPDRAYFIEVGNDTEGWIQIFQPYGVPRSCPCSNASRANGQ